MHACRCRGYGALCDHLVEAIQQDSGPAAGDTPQQQIQQRMEQQRADRLLLLRLACRWCLRAASRPILKQQLQQLACSSLQAALQSAAASQPPAAPACPSAAFVAALYCLAECQLAVCEGPLTALYSAPPSPLKEVKGQPLPSPLPAPMPEHRGQGQRSGGASSATVAAGLDTQEAERVLLLATLVQRANAVLAQHLPMESLGSSSDDSSAGGGSGSGGGTCDAAVQSQTQLPSPSGQLLLLLRAVVCGGRWAAQLSSLQQQAHEAKVFAWASSYARGRRRAWHSLFH